MMTRYLCSACFHIIKTCSRLMSWNWEILFATTLGLIFLQTQLFFQFKMKSNEFRSIFSIQLLSNGKKKWLGINWGHFCNCFSSLLHAGMRFCYPTLAGLICIFSTLERRKFFFVTGPFVSMARFITMKRKVSLFL